jgi:AraC family transcriptional regulator of adaptative response/methylated-DNA-[protein]-cysteine methyltransferase
VTPREYVRARRLGRLKEQLRNGASVTAAMYDAGYGSSSRLYETSDSTLGMTPGIYGRGGRGMRVAYMMADSPLGRLLVAATERGVCSVNMGDSDEELEAGLRREYPAAEIAPWHGGKREGMALWLELVVSQVGEGSPTVNLPLDVQVSAFQAKVYAELRNIPRGETRSYGDVARAIGRPRAMRAVGNACGTNPVPLVIPCHRVIAGDGSIGGYGGGVERKRKLLRMEGATIPKEAQAAG